MISQRNFYNSIFNWNYLIKNGYFDFKNTSIWYKGEIQNEYGQDDVIDPTYFNLDDILREDILSKVTNQVYIDYPQGSRIVDSREITSNIGTIIRKKRIEVPPTSPIIFNIPKDDGTKRKLKFPNIYAYFSVISVLLNNKEYIIQRLIKDENSTSRFFNIRPYTFERTKDIQEKLLCGYRYFYKTDLSTFFHTFYTHTIAWIVNSKQLRYLNYFGNLLDSVIELEQDQETHGVPTGNLATRIIIEYCMTFLDEELNKSFKKLDISFHRYVDDFIFAYNEEKDLAVIKKAMNNIASRYELNINGRKSTKIDYYDLHKNSQLIGYFDGIEINEKLKPKKLKNYITKYISLAENEKLMGIKGTLKLVFTGLTFFLQGYRNKKIQKNILLALTFRLERNEATVLDRLSEIAYLDSRIGIYYIRFIEKALRIERKIGSNILNSYFHDQYDNLEFRKKFEDRFCKQIFNNRNQSYYDSLVITKKVGCRFSKNAIVSGFDIASRDDVDLDDFSAILMLENYMDNVRYSQDSDSYKQLLKTLQQLLTIEIKSKYFANDHWLLRYQLLHLYITNDIYKEAVNKFYREENIEDKFQVLNIEKCKHYTGYGTNSSSNIDDFFFYLLTQKISFTNVTKFYKSNDV